LDDALTLSCLPRRHHLPSPSSSPSPDASLDPAASSNRKRAHEDESEGQLELEANDEGESATASTSNSVGVRALYALHFTRLQQLRVIEQKLKEVIHPPPQASTPDTAQHSLAFDQLDTCEAMFQLLECSRTNHSRSALSPPHSL